MQKDALNSAFVVAIIGLIGLVIAAIIQGIVGPVVVPVIMPWLAPITTPSASRPSAAVASTSPQVAVVQPTRTSVQAPSPTLLPVTIQPTAVPTRIPSPAPIASDFNGNWATNIGSFSLVQKGDQVTGTFQSWSNEIDGKVSGVAKGNRLVLESSTVLGDGFVWVLNSDNQSFTSNNKYWGICGVRSGPLSEGCGFAGGWYLKTDLAGSPLPSYAVISQTAGIVSGTIFNSDKSTSDSLTALHVAWNGKAPTVAGRTNKGVLIQWYIDSNGTILGSTNVDRNDLNLVTKWCGNRENKLGVDVCGW